MTQSRMASKIGGMCLMLLLAYLCKAQHNAKYYAPIDAIQKAGFYSIELSPAVIAKCNDDFSDVRLLDNGHHPTPYIVEKNNSGFSIEEFVDFPITSKGKGDDTQTYCVVENNTGKAIDHLLLVTQNTDAQRMVSISGSNDGKDFYIVKENIALNNGFTQEKTKSIQPIYFPLVAYQYFKIIFLGKDVLPVNIVKVGMNNSSHTQGVYRQLQQTRLQQIDSPNKKSYLYLTLPDRHSVDKLALQVSSPKFFNRAVSVYVDNIHTTRTPFFTHITPTNTELNLNGLRARQLVLVIDNQDNPPLQVTEIHALQLGYHLLAYLEPSVPYQLYFGDSLAEKPTYDIRFFSDSMGSQLPVISVQAVQENPAASKVQPPAKPSSNNKVWLWAIIALATAVLLLLTFKMMREINKKR